MNDAPLVSLLKTRMHWYQARQKVLAENVANANTPGFKPRDLSDPVAGEVAGLAMQTTSAAHLAGFGGGSGADVKAGLRYETRPSGNSVTLEDEMLKASANSSDFQLAASLYQKSLSMLRLAATGRA